MPGATLVLESIEHWWAEHPLHAAGALAEEASRRYIGPIARKNPVAVIVGGAVFGALLVASKPWRWLLRPALFFGLVPQIAAQALKRMPLDAWLQMLSTFSGKRAAQKAEPAAARPGIRLAKGALNRLPPNGPLPTRPRGIGRSPSVGSLKNALRRVFFSATRHRGSASC